MNLSEKQSNLQKKTINLKSKVESLNSLFRDLGVVTFLCGQSKYHQNFTSGHILAYVIPAIKANKYKIFYKDTMPRGFITWANMSAEVSNKYEKGDYVLRMDDINSGDDVWITEFVTPHDDNSEDGDDRKHIIKNLKEDLFKNDKVRVLVRNEDGSVKRIFTSFGKNYKK